MKYALFITFSNMFTVWEWVEQFSFSVYFYGQGSKRRKRLSASRLPPPPNNHGYNVVILCAVRELLIIPNSVSLLGLSRIPRDNAKGIIKRENLFLWSHPTLQYISKCTLYNRKTANLRKIAVLLTMVSQVFQI